VDSRKLEVIIMNPLAGDFVDGRQGRIPADGESADGQMASRATNLLIAYFRSMTLSGTVFQIIVPLPSPHISSGGREPVASPISQWTDHL
jgi:hypothetical protein